MMRLDLNLVTVLEAIMLERNITRAAASLAMSQPAVSNALRRARSLTGDRLFLKVAAGVQPTARMLAIWPDIHRSLAAIRASIAPQDFDPRTETTTFRIAITDSLAVEAVSHITLKLHVAAPFARVFFTFHTNASSLEGIERGTLDCAIGMFPVLPRDINVRAVRADRYLCVMRRGHKLAHGMTVEQFVAAAHVLVTPSGMDLGVVDGWLSLQGHRRNIIAVVNHFADALRIVADSELLTCVPHDFMDGAGRTVVPRRKLITRDLPFETDKLQYKMIWHERLNGHPAHQWCRSLVAEICGVVPEDQASR
jgi:DNA-binding transcriptional LysR family regulator